MKYLIIRGDLYSWSLSYVYIIFYCLFLDLYINKKIKVKAYINLIKH